MHQLNVHGIVVEARLPAARYHAVLLAMAALAGACGGKQEFVLVPDAHAECLTSRSRYVVDVTVQHAESIERVNYPFMQTRTRNVTLAVDRVLKGGDQPATLLLHDYRALRPGEYVLFPRGFGFINGIRLRLGFDARAGDRFRDLKIAPIGMSPWLEKTVRASESQRNGRGAEPPDLGTTSSPSTRPGRPRHRSSRRRPEPPTPNPAPPRAWAGSRRSRRRSSAASRPPAARGPCPSCRRRP